MSAGLPFLLVSILAWLILVVWANYGAGPKRPRMILALSISIALIACWLLVLNFGALHPAGSYGMGFGFLLCLLALFTPQIWRTIQRRKLR